MHYYERRNPRLKKHDYNSNCDYFITICTNNRLFLFGNIDNSNPNIILGSALIPDPRIEIEKSNGFDLNAVMKQFPDIITVYHPGEMVLNNYGKIVKEVWEELPKHYPVELAAYQIMPNHVHLSFTIDDLTEGAACCAPTQIEGRPQKEYFEIKAVAVKNNTALGNVIRSFKSEVTKRISQINEEKGDIWQRGYYDHIIRDYDDYKRIRTYIVLNPKIWFRDRNNPKSSGF